MKKLGKSEALLDLINRPGFTVMHGRICHVNQAAGAIHIQEGTPVESLLPNDMQAYMDFTGGCLYLTVRVYDVDCGASVTRNGKTDIFILDDPTGGDQLTALALAGNQLKTPLSNITALLDTHFTDKTIHDPDMLRHLSQIRKNLSCLHRSALAMSDCCSWTAKCADRDTGDLCAVFKEVMEKCATLLSNDGIFIQYNYPREADITQFHYEMLYRAMLNMVSNAAKYSVLKPMIDAELTVTGDRARISVQSPCSDEEQHLFYNAFSNYLRKPSLEDSRLGIGLGMTYIRNAAISHNGTALIDRPGGDKIRVSITLKLEPPTSSTVLRNHIGRLSNYAGGMDLALIELSDVLSAQNYH